MVKHENEGVVTKHVHFGDSQTVTFLKNVSPMLVKHAPPLPKHHESILKHDHPLEHHHPSHTAALLPQKQIDSRGRKELFLNSVSDSLAASPSMVPSPLRRAVTLREVYKPPVVKQKNQVVIEKEAGHYPDGFEVWSTTGGGTRRLPYRKEYHDLIRALQEFRVESENGKLGARTLLERNPEMFTLGFRVNKTHPMSTHYWPFNMMEFFTTQAMGACCYSSLELKKKAVAMEEFLSEQNGKILENGEKVTLYITPVGDPGFGYTFQMERMRKEVEEARRQESTVVPVLYDTSATIAVPKEPSRETTAVILRV